MIETEKYTVDEWRERFKEMLTILKHFYTRRPSNHHVLLLYCLESIKFVM